MDTRSFLELEVCQRVIGMVLEGVFPGQFQSQEHATVLGDCLSALDNGQSTGECFTELADICNAEGRGVRQSHHFGNRKTGVLFCMSPSVTPNVWEITMAVDSERHEELIPVLQALEAFDKDATISVNMVKMPIKAALRQFPVPA